MNNTILNMDPIAKHQGEGWNRETTTEVYQDAEYTIFAITNKETRQEIKFRNVGDKNPDATIQFTCEEASFIGKRPKYLSFSLPGSLAELFIKSLQTKNG